jgi:hypothetical protein
MNLFTYGRSVTLAIQTMKHTEADFSDWWAPYQAKMQSDPLMKFFNKTRTDILHEGELSTGSRTEVGASGPVDLGALFAELNKHAPPNTVSTFFGDTLGGNGWEVQLPDGSCEKVYFQLPSEADVTSTFVLNREDLPDQHDGELITDTSIDHLGGLYIRALETIVNDFIARFSD